MKKNHFFSVVSKNRGIEDQVDGTDKSQILKTWHLRLGEIFIKMNYLAPRLFA
jgi:hypothetical protein